MAPPFAMSGGADGGADLVALGRRLLAEGPVRTLTTPKRVRIQLGGAVVADTAAALYVWEKPFYPFYYVPAAAFARDALDADALAALEGLEGEDACAVVPLRGPDGTSTDRVLAFGARVPAARRALAGLVRVEFGAADAWFEEDERVYVHPRDPFKRVDILLSTRPLRVLVDGAVVAHAPGGALHLHETGLPVRYYLPPTAVDPARLRPSATTTECPYKGVANYYSLVLGAGAAERTLVDVVWYYRNPTHESARVAGLLCFYNEKVDIELDGVLLERPKTIFA